MKSPPAAASAGTGREQECSFGHTAGSGIRVGMHPSHENLVAECQQYGADKHAAGRGVMWFITGKRAEDQTPSRT
jgi:hypothetical protein